MFEVLKYRPTLLENTEIRGSVFALLITELRIRRSSGGRSIELRRKRCWALWMERRGAQEEEALSREEEALGRGGREALGAGEGEGDLQRSQGEGRLIDEVSSVEITECV